jgi:hypothetical protein
MNISQHSESAANTQVVRAAQVVHASKARASKTALQIPPSPLNDEAPENAMREDRRTDDVVPVTVRRIDNQLLQFLLERRDPEYDQCPEDSDAVEFHVMLQDLNADRQPVPEAKKARDVEDALAVQQ